VNRELEISAASLAELAEKKLMLRPVRLRVLSPVHVLVNLSVHITVRAESSGLDVDSFSDRTRNPGFSDNWLATGDNWLSSGDPVLHWHFDDLFNGFGWLFSTPLLDKWLFFFLGFLLGAEVNDDSDNQQQKEQGTEENQNPSPPSANAIVTSAVSCRVDLVAVDLEGPEAAFSAIHSQTIKFITVFSIAVALVVLKIEAHGTLASNSSRRARRPWEGSCAADIGQRDAEIKLTHTQTHSCRAQ